MFLGRGCFWSVPETRVRKNASNLVRESPTSTPPSDHTRENRKRHGSHSWLCEEGGGGRRRGKEGEGELWEGKGGGGKALTCV